MRLRWSCRRELDWLTLVVIDLGVNSETLRTGLNRAKIDRGLGLVGVLTTAEREEFIRLRRRDVELEQERSIVVRAAVIFAKETTR